MGIAKTHTEIRTASSRLLEDPSNNIWSTDTLDAIMVDALVEVSEYSARNFKETKSTTAGSKDLGISDISNLLGVDYAVWPVDFTPERRRSVEVYGDVLTLDVTIAPGSADDVKLACRKVHTLVENLADKTGAVNNGSGYSEGDVTIILDGLGSGTIKKNTIVTFNGINGEYLVIAGVDIAANAATIVLDHGLLEDMDDDTVVTFVCSTLTPRLENLLPQLIAARAKVNWTGEGRTQLMSSIDNLAEVAIALESMTPLIVQAATDVDTSRTETDKILTDILQAGTAIDAETANIITAVALIASGGVEADKVATAVSAARTALGNVAAQTTLGVADLASGRTENAKTVALISSANDEFVKMDEQIDLGIGRLMEATTVINAVTVGADPAGREMALANRFVGMSQGYQAAGQAFMNQAAADMRVSGSYNQLASTEFQASNTLINEAQGHLAEASGDTGAAAGFAQLALSELRAGQESRQQGVAYLQKAQAEAMSGRAYQGVVSSGLQVATEDMNQAIATIRQATGRLNVARLIQGYQRESERGLNAVVASLRALKGPNQRRQYARGD